MVVETPAAPVSEHPGMFVTFYSFKGGVGRSMALANVAEILADAGYRVVICDWDLEAPGLERYFLQTETDAFGEELGIIDLLLEYKQRLRDVGGAFQGSQTLASLTPPSKYARFVKSDRARGGSVRILAAGRHAGSGASNYARSVQEFDWTEFYEKWAGGSYLEFFRRELLEHADVVLIDSRTGVTEQGGVCTHHLADLVLLMTAANDLNLRGTQWMAERLSRKELAQFRDGRPLSLLPIASRIEQTSERNELGSFRSRIEQGMHAFVDEHAGDGVAFLRASEIPYIPYYSFQERVAARETSPIRELLNAYTAIARSIVRIGVRKKLLKAPTLADWVPDLADGAQRSVEEDTALARRLSAHLLWLESGGDRGQRASFRGERHVGIDLSERDLQRADFERASIEEASLRGANLGEAELTSASLKNADLRSADLTEAICEDADLSGANLQGARCTGTNLRLAKLQNANLGGSRLDRADLTGANLDGALLRACNLRGATLLRVKGLTQRQLREAVLDDETLLPDDIARTFGRDKPTAVVAATSVPPMPRPVCYVSMPFGRKVAQDGRTIDFNQIYESAIRPAIEEADLTCIRADEEASPGIIHKLMFERLMSSPFVVVDLSTVNGNVLYNLGLRHALRPRHTVTIIDAGTALPFDINFLPTIYYGSRNSAELSPEAAAELRHRLSARLRELRQSTTRADSPIYQLFDLRHPDVDAIGTDLDRARAEYIRMMTVRLSAIRASSDGLPEFEALHAQLGAVHDLPWEVVVKCFEVLRALGGSTQTLQLYEQIDPALRARVDIQLFRVRALVALERLGEAVELIETLIEQHDADPRLFEWRGRVTRELWKAAETERQAIRAKGLLRQAITWYRRAFDANLASPTAGIQVLNLLQVEGSSESRRLRERLLPVVRYAVERHLAEDPSYWDLSCGLNLALLDDNGDMALDLLSRMLSMDPEPWMLGSTRRDIENAIAMRRRSGSMPQWLEDVVSAIETPHRDS